MGGHRVSVALVGTFDHYSSESGNEGGREGGKEDLSVPGVALGKAVGLAVDLVDVEFLRSVQALQSSEAVDGDA